MTVVTAVVTAAPPQTGDAQSDVVAQQVDFKAEPDVAISFRPPLAGGSFEVGSFAPGTPISGTLFYLNGAGQRSPVPLVVTDTVPDGEVVPVPNPADGALKFTYPIRR